MRGGNTKREPDKFTDIQSSLKSGGKGHEDLEHAVHGKDVLSTTNQLPSPKLLAKLEAGARAFRDVTQR